MKHLKLFVVFALLVALPALSRPSHKPARGMTLKQVCWEFDGCLHHCEQRNALCIAHTHNEAACDAAGDVCYEMCSSGQANGCSSPF